MRKESRF